MIWEESKSDAVIDQINRLKCFLIENQNELDNILVLYKFENISKLTASMLYKFDPFLIWGSYFELFITENLSSGFKSDDSLIANIPDYISLGYNKNQTNLKAYGTPISLSFNIDQITMKTLSIFWHIRNKNIVKVLWDFKINRDYRLSTKAERKFLSILRNLQTLQELKLTISTNSESIWYSFKNLWKSRLIQIVDSIWGMKPEIKNPEELLDLALLQKFSDL